MARASVSRRRKQRETEENLRLPQLEKFLHKASSYGEKFSARQRTELGKFFLENVLGFSAKEFIACSPSDGEAPDFVPHNDNHYPWAFFVTNKKDLQEEYHDRAILYLHSELADKKNHVVIINNRELCVFDFNHEVAEYTVLFSDLVEGNTDARKNWLAFLNDFCVPYARTC